jgi:anaphase-promoting complex subunit 2
LHPGANTKDIITQYISLIRVLRVLDPPGVLLARVAGGIRAYLRGRSDTIRCIVSGMIEDDSELMRELLGAGDDGHDATRAGEVRGLLTEKQEDLIESFVDENYTWTPAPVDAPADYSRNRAADIIQLLVSIYDTKELFIKELQTLLAGRLLAIKAYAYDKELRSVETLKVRFGEQALQGLEVMLKDCADSKRTDTALHGVAPVSLPSGRADTRLQLNYFHLHVSQISASPLHSTIISHLFWPEYRKSSLRLPGQLGRLTSAYEASYRKHKPGKKLTWLPTMGSVTMEIQLRDRTVEVETDPLKASVLELFSEQRKYRSILTGRMRRL